MRAERGSRASRPVGEEGGAPAPARVTIAQVAAAAGVAPSTVSKVLNGNADVSSATRQRVQRLLSEHNYARRRSAHAASAPFVDLVFQELESPWAMEIVRGAVHAACEAGLSVSLTSLSEEGSSRSWLDQICARGSRGVILLLARLGQRERSELRSRGLPFAMVDPRGEPDPAVATVGATNWAGGFAATRHLVELGHRRVGVISGPLDLLCSRARMDGYRSAMEAAGLPVDPDLMQWGDFHVDGGFKVAMAMLGQHERPTAIFAGSDLQALGVLEAARVQHLRVPVDLSLVGFDDLPLSTWTSPPLTTVRQPLAEMAATAVRLVLAQDRDGRAEPRSVELATTLIVRETTAALR
ncbi:MAG TPA: LacI family DNA-binding transcriptional regulator [Acidimicrobiales bacterium]|nr:LacI family DNA-binding transcriptional regulator [Acidimicrobiales bacterium]